MARQEAAGHFFTNRSFLVCFDFFRRNIRSMNFLRTVVFYFHDLLFACPSRLCFPRTSSPPSLQCAGSARAFSCRRFSSLYGARIEVMYPAVKEGSIDLFLLCVNLVKCRLSVLVRDPEVSGDDEGAVRV
jgi:hypothetical protein